MGILLESQIHNPACLENTNRTLHTLKTLCICDGNVPKLDTNSIMGSLWVGSIRFPLTGFHVFQIATMNRHFRFISLWAGLCFYLMSAALWTSAWFHSEICAAALTCSLAHCLQMGSLTWNHNSFQMRRAQYIFEPIKALTAKLNDGNVQYQDETTTGLIVR